ncbi:TnsA-like heteromeric transposase endonuclease subunit [Kitasatospora sp. NPDC004723]|uniref:TnsA-like heteromeric transposase endonuclease subunit n=1 Tax=Kitasatospora sp. NPDC004723 TaxID=3154288 RepID=UPI0033B8B444
MTRRRTVRPIALALGQVLVRYCDQGGTERLVTAVDATKVRFEDGRPVRDIPSYADQKHTPGKLWFATSDRFLEYESYLESKWMKLLDFDPEVANVAAQPFELEGRDQGGVWRHTPDLFARLRDGSVQLLDVKPDRFTDRLDVARQRQRTAAVSEAMGWQYAMVGEPDPLRWASVKWLAGYRRPSTAADELAAPLLELAADPVAIGDLLAFQPAPDIARAVVYHLMWHHRLAFDITKPLRDHTLVWSRPAPETCP